MRCQHFARQSVIYEKLEDAIAIGPHLVQMHQTGSEERTSGKGEQRGADLCVFANKH